MPNIPSRGWYARVTPASGHVHEPSIIQSDAINPQQTPQANAVPRIRLPVPKDDRWREVLGDGTTDVDLDVYHDGARQPIDTLVDVEDAPGHTVLVGEGGRELRTRVEASYDQRAVHLAAQDLIDNNTTYASNVDTPTTTTETNTTLVTLTSNSEFLTRTSTTPTDPIEVTGGDLQQAQTGFFVEAEDASTETGGRGTTGSEDNNYSGAAGEVVESTGDIRTWEITPTHTIPANQVGIQVRVGLNSGSQSVPAFTWTLGGSPVDFLQNAGTSLGSLGWDDIGSGIYDGGGYAGGDLIGGNTYTLRVEVDDGGAAADKYAIDCVFVYDKGTDGRFTANYTFDNSTDSNDTLDGPELFPDEMQVAFDLVPAPQAVTGIRAEATLNGGESGYTHYLSNDQGVNFTSGTGANFETDALGATWGPGITYKAGLSRFGSRTTASPNSGFSGQHLQEVTLKADLEDVPLVVNRTFDGHLDSILRELANMGDQLWEYRNAAGTESIEWTSPGQRTATQTPGVNDYQATKTTGEVYQKAIVYGQPDVQVRGERFESNHGSAVSLANDRLQQGSELVTDPDSGQRFNRGADYTMDYQAGEITTLSGGDMSNSTDFDIDYRYQAFGQFDDGTASPAITPRIDLPGLWSDFLCQQAARLIVDEVSSPIHTATVTLPNDETGWSVVESLALGIVPTGMEQETTLSEGYGLNYGDSYGGLFATNTVSSALHVKDVENTPQATVLTLGSRRSLSDVVGDIRAQVGAVSQKA